MSSLKVACDTDPNTCTCWFIFKAPFTQRRNIAATNIIMPICFFRTEPNKAALCCSSYSIREKNLNTTALASRHAGCDVYTGIVSALLVPLLPAKRRNNIIPPAPLRLYLLYRWWDGMIHYEQAMYKGLRIHIDVSSYATINRQFLSHSLPANVQCLLHFSLCLVICNKPLHMLSFEVIQCKLLKCAVFFYLLKKIK